jgi:hypothetical protein
VVLESGIAKYILMLGVCILLPVRSPGDWGGGGVITSTQRYYRRLFLLFNIT